MEAGLEAFIVEQQPRLVAALVLLTGDVHVAEDLAQEALVRLIPRWQRIQAYDAPAAWLHRVAINLARSRWRRITNARAMRVRATEPPLGPVDLDEVLALRSALAVLPARQREALILRHVVGLSPDEVAEALGCTPQAVRNLTNRATTTLRAQLADRSPA